MSPPPSSPRDARSSTSTWNVSRTPRISEISLFSLPILSVSFQVQFELVCHIQAAKRAEVRCAVRIILLQTSKDPREYIYFRILFLYHTDTHVTTETAGFGWMVNSLVCGRCVVFLPKCYLSKCPRSRVYSFAKSAPRCVLSYWRIISVCFISLIGKVQESVSSWDQ